MFGCSRLGARVWDLKHKYGIPVLSRPKKVKPKTVVSEYYVDENFINSLNNIQ